MSLYTDSGMTIDSISYLILLIWRLMTLKWTNEECVKPSHCKIASFGCHNNFKWLKPSLNNHYSHYRLNTLKILNVCLKNWGRVFTYKNSS